MEESVSLVTCECLREKSWHMIVGRVGGSILGGFSSLPRFRPSGYLLQDGIGNESTVVGSRSEDRYGVAGSSARLGGVKSRIDVNAS